MLTEPIHGVVVSVSYADYLDISLTHNRPLMHSCVVATRPDDKETQRVAVKHDCRLIMTEAIRPGDDGRGFNKGMMIEQALQQLPHTGWRCVWDADIIMPGNTLQKLAVALHDKEAIYGCDRFNVVGWDAYQRLLSSGWATKGFDHHHYLQYSPHGAEIVGRLVYGNQGWCPVGFLQIYHTSSEYSGNNRIRPYPTVSSSAAHDDVKFSLLWDRHKRIFIPELLVGHLTTGDTRYGANWASRKTKKFVADNEGTDDAKGIVS